jgi:hypothetical protein
VRRVSALDIVASLRASYDASRGYGHGLKLALRGGTTLGDGERRGQAGPDRLRLHDDLDSLAASAEESAATTHARPLGRAGAVALAIFSFLRGAPDFEAVMTNAVLAGGDTDTVAAMNVRVLAPAPRGARIPFRSRRTLEPPRGRGARAASIPRRATTCVV